MAFLECATEVNADTPVVYEHWLDLGSFPGFLPHVIRVQYEDETHTLWRVSIGGVCREFHAEITRTVPPELITWHSTAGEPPNAGRVRFSPVDANRTRVTLSLVLRPHTRAERLICALGVLRGCVWQDLRAFRDYVEGRA